jgi:Na+/melibiose symporter-like transporter
MIPFSFGAREPEDMKIFRADLDESGKGTSPVKEVVIRILKDRNWMAFTMAVFFWSIAGMCLVAGLDFFIVHYLGLDYSAIIFPSLVAIAGGVISIPIFAKLVRKFGAKKAYLTSLFLFFIFYLVFFFVEDLTGLTTAFFLVGIASGGQTIIYVIVSSEAIDNSVILSNKREEGTYNGILRIFTGFSYVFQTLIFAIVSSYTGYIPAKGKNQTELARFGLKLQMSLIPMFIILIGIIIFVYFYKISKEQAVTNKKKLIEMKL